MYLDVFGISGAFGIFWLLAVLVNIAWFGVYKMCWGPDAFLRDRGCIASHCIGWRHVAIPKGSMLLF